MHYKGRKFQTVLRFQTWPKHDSLKTCLSSKLFTFLLFHYLNYTVFKELVWLQNCVNAWERSLITICEMSQNRDMFQRVFCAQTLHLQNCDMFLNKIKNDQKFRS